MDKENRRLPAIGAKFSSYATNGSSNASSAKKLSEFDELIAENEDILGHHSPSKQDDSLDFENSDDINNIISKYERMLDKPRKETTSDLK